jgi:hypothetical protein
MGGMMTLQMGERMIWMGEMDDTTNGRGCHYEWEGWMTHWMGERTQWIGKRRTPFIGSVTRWTCRMMWIGERRALPVGSGECDIMRV